MSCLIPHFVSYPHSLSTPFLIPCFSYICTPCEYHVLTLIVTLSLKQNCCHLIFCHTILKSVLHTSIIPWCQLDNKEMLNKYFIITLTYNYIYCLILIICWNNIISFLTLLCMDMQVKMVPLKLAFMIMLYKDL